MSTATDSRDEIEAAARRVMAQRAAIKLRYDTREERAALLAKADALILEWVEAADGSEEDR